MHNFLIILLLNISVIESGQSNMTSPIEPSLLASSEKPPLMCYKCHQTSRACVSGDSKELQADNCTLPNSVCVVFIYETDVFGGKVTAPLRGCQPEIPGGICKSLMTTVKEHGQTKRGIFCHTCNTTLCNAANQLNFGCLVPLVSYLVFKWALQL